MPACRVTPDGADAPQRGPTRHTDYNRTRSPNSHWNRALNLVILDRDGVINEALPGHVRSADDWRPIPGSLDAIARLGRAGYRVVVATRQPGIRRRHLTFEDLNRIHELMHRRLAEYGATIDAVFTCLCLPGYDCDCFRPRPSVLHEIAERLHVSLGDVPCVGGTPEFLETALAAGARSMLVRTGTGRATRGGGAGRDAVELHDDLAQAVDALLAEA